VTKLQLGHAPAAKLRFRLPSSPVTKTASRNHPPQHTTPDYCSTHFDPGY
jgi:hypothetical protein